MSFERRVILMGNLLTFACGVCLCCVITTDTIPTQIYRVDTVRYIREDVVTVSEYMPPDEITITIHGEEVIERVERQFSNPPTPTVPANQTQEIKYTGEKLTKTRGVLEGPSGKETWYNLPMGGVIKIMRDLGYSEKEYPYWTREDGAKMLGDYVMIAANLILRPRGTVVETSLGLGIVCDTGGFAVNNETAIDIAVNW